MLLTIPVELQVSILGLLPRRDLARVVRTSRHLHAVGVTILYAHVELRSLDQVEAFFQITSSLPQGSTVASRHADTKRDQWKAIKTLDINIATDKRRTAPLVNLPRSLRGQGVDRLPLDGLRLTYHDTPSPLLALFQCFNPREVGLHRYHWKVDRHFDRWVAATGWDNVKHLTFIGDELSLQQGTKTTSIRFPTVERITLVCHYWADSVSTDSYADAGILVRLCPNAVALEFRVFADWTKQEIEEMASQKQSEMPAVSLSVVLASDTTNVWGEKAHG